MVRILYYSPCYVVLCHGLLCCVLLCCVVYRNNFVITCLTGVNRQSTRIYHCLNYLEIIANLKIILDKIAFSKTNRFSSNWNTCSKAVQTIRMCVYASKQPDVAAWGICYCVNKQDAGASDEMYDTKANSTLRYVFKLYVFWYFSL